MRYVMKAVFTCPEGAVQGVDHFVAESEEEMKQWLGANFNYIAISCLGPDYINPHIAARLKKLCEKKKEEAK